MAIDSLIGELTRIVGKSHVSVNRVDTELYSYDASLAKGQPAVVVFPADTSQTALVVKAANAAGVPFVARGFGTNLSGGTVLVSGGLVIAMTRMNRILDISPEKRCAVVQPAVTNLELQNALAPLGYFYAPDPASQKVATLGGNVGENSGGPHCVKYGVTTNHVLGMETVLPDGQVVCLGGPALDPPGYDLRGVMVGSEGTFGIVTEVTVRILRKPQAVATLLAIYDDVSDAARSVSDIVSAGIIPATLEMMDAPIIRAVEDSYACGYPRDAAAVLIIEVEGPDVGLNAQARRIQDICRNHGCREIRQAADDAERNRLWDGRRGAFGAVARLAPNYLVNDCTVPRTKLPEALAQVAQICSSHGFEHGNVFHAGDGNLHPLILFDSRDADQLKRVKKAGRKIMEACVALGGTISGEHGIGLEKIEAMRLIFSEADLSAQRTLQRAFDPQQRINPKKVIPEPLDPAGPETPADAAEQAILDEIRRIAAAGQSVRPQGTGAHSAFGNLSQKGAVAVSSAFTADWFDHDPANLVVTAGAGMSMEQLQEKLSAHGQWLPIRPPFCRHPHTVGGLVATGACGPERLVYGAPRDLLLGLTFIGGHLTRIAAGGRVVKNVSGYDMTRLLAGSAGTLGLITRATFKTAMVPQRAAMMTGSGSLADCAKAASAILASNIGPFQVVATPTGNPETFHWQLHAGFEGFPEVVADQIERGAKLFCEAGLDCPGIYEYGSVSPFQENWEQIERTPFRVRADVPVGTGVNGFSILFASNLPESALIDFGCGRVWAGLADLDEAAWAEITNLAAGLNGHAQVEKAPESFKRRNDVFGPPRPEWKVTHRIKAALDPNHLFSPGTLPGKK
jgi:D-lactate dehydrogenase (cytochrome)